MVGDVIIADIQSPMTDGNRDDIFDAGKYSKGHICCLCECDPSVHVCFFKCPIFDKELICSECCLMDALRSGIDEKFSEKLGRKITREEINALCRDCGRNHAIEDSALADELDWNTIAEDDQEETDYEERG